MKNIIRVFFILMIAAVFAGCSGVSGSRVPKYPTDLTDEMKTSFEQAEQLYLAGSLAEAQALYQNYVASFGYNSLTDEAKFKLGEIAFINKKYPAALSHYKEAYENLYNPNIAPKAQFKAAMTLNLLGRRQEAHSTLDQMERRDLSRILALRTDSLAVTVATELNRFPNGLVKWYLFLLDDYAAISPKEYEGKIPEALISRDVAYENVMNWVRDANVTLEGVETLPLKDMSGKPSGGYLLYKLAVVNYTHGNFDMAKKYLKQFTNGYPKNEFAADAGALLAELKGRKGGKAVKIGVLLPLSGRFSLYGNSTLHGVQCAAGLTAPCTSSMKVELVVRDTMGDPQTAARGVEELTDEGVIAIVGPLLSATVSSASRKAQELGIPLVSLSQREQVAETGEYVFKHALTSMDQVNTLADYAVGQRKIKKFGILYPSSKYGVNFAGLFKSAVEARGGSVIFERGYSHNDLRGSEATSDMGSFTSVDSAVSGGTQKRFAVPEGVQAVFIPDSYKAVRYVVRSVHHDSSVPASDILFLGVNRWNNPGLVVGDLGLLEGAVFVDGFYKESSDITTRHFVQSFLNAFRMDPTILEAQAYDAVRLLMAGVQNGGTSRSKLASVMRNLKNVGGATGTIGIRENGESYRNLFILTVKHGVIAELSSARKALPKNEFSYSPAAKTYSGAKYEGTKVPDLTIRTDVDKYEMDEHFFEGLE